MTRMTQPEFFQYVRDARRHAEQCLAAIGGWDVETLGTNIESNFPGLLSEECDEIACAAIDAEAK